MIFIIRIIDGRGTGKTSRLMLIAKQSNAYFVCRSPYAAREKSLMYGITGIDFISYRDYVEKTETYSDRKVIIDDIEDFMRDVFGNNICAYSITDED